MTSLYTLDEVAAHLRVSLRTVRRFVSSGQLRAVKMGRKPLVTERELEAFVASRKVA